jgi:hypothetical protein
MHRAMSGEQRRLIETMRSTVADYGARSRDKFAGRMQWMTVKKRTIGAAGSLMVTQARAAASYFPRTCGLLKARPEKRRNHEQ